MDGTLYPLIPVWFLVLSNFLFYYLIRPSRFKEVKMLNQYRIIRKKELFLEYPDFDFRQKDYLAKKYNLSQSRVQNIINYWLIEKSLKLINKFKNKKLLATIKQFEDNGGTVIIYSDFPVKRKLKALNLQVHYQFHSGDEHLKQMKPSKENMEKILSITGFKPEEVLFVGNSYEKDGKSAEAVGMEYLNV